MAQKIRFTKPTYNAITETDPNNIIFSSDYDTLKYLTQGLKTVTVNYASYYSSYLDAFATTHYRHYETGEVTHSLGYTPYFAGYYLFTTSAIQLPLAFADAFDFIYASVYADSSKLYFMIWFSNTSNSGTVDIDFSYRIFKNDLGI